MTDDEYVIRPVGRVESPLLDPADAPKQGDEGAPEAWISIGETFRAAARDLAPGDDVYVLTWLDRADRSTLVVHPRDDLSNPQRGVFSTRSADRPNPIGLHRVTILAVEGARLRVANLEAIDGTPVIDVKPVLSATDAR